MANSGRVQNLIDAQTKLALAKTAIDAESAGGPKTADQNLFRAVVLLLEAIQSSWLDDSGSQVPATPDVA
jgi:hypothetical protein